MGWNYTPEMIKGNYKQPCACGQCDKLIWHWGTNKYKNRFASGHQFMGKHPANYKGGYLQDGYKVISRKGHRRAKTDGHRVFEHVTAYEDFHKCCLLDWVLIHHKNGNKLDNRPKNLEPTTRSKHIKMHHSDIHNS